MPVVDAPLRFLCILILHSCFAPLHGRTRAAGHPGAPPPAACGRKRRKPHKRHHRTRCADEEQTPSTHTQIGKSHHAVCARLTSKKSHDRHHHPAGGVAGSCRDKSHTGQRGGCCSDDYCCRPTTREVLVSERGQPSGPAHPASASASVACVHQAGSTSPPVSGHHHHRPPQQEPGVAGGAVSGWREEEPTDRDRAINRAARYVNCKADERRRRRSEDDCRSIISMSKDNVSAQSQTVARENLSSGRTLGPASVDRRRRRASLLKVTIWQRQTIIYHGVGSLFVFFVGERISIPPSWIP